MNSASEVLETVLAITGAAHYIAQMGEAAAGAATLATAEGAATVATEGLAGALGALSVVVAPVLVVLALLREGLDLTTKALDAFSEESQQVFQTAIVLKNLGTSLPIGALKEFADQASRTMGVSRQALEGAAGLLARVGLTGQQIESILPTIIDTSKATGDSVEAVTEAVERGVEGRGRALRKYGFELEDTGSKVANLARLHQQLDLRFAGAGQASTQEFFGAAARMATAVHNLFSDIGEKLAPIAITVLNSLTAVFQALDQHVNELITALSPLLGLVALLHSSSSNPAAKIGHGGDPATEKTVQQIADNTSKVADVIEEAVLGGAGTRAKQAFTWRDASLAMRI